VLFGLLIAVLADRSSFERVAKSFIFLPMAISFVGAGIIWNFIYEFRPTTTPQIGLLNEIVVSLEGRPKPGPMGRRRAVEQSVPDRDRRLAPGGFRDGAFLGGLKGIPEELLEAARIDGANEFQIFFRIMLPYIGGTVVGVWTTIVIFTLKIFDVVWVMTGGQFGTHVIATQFYRQSFTNRTPVLVRPLPSCCCLPWCQ